MTGLKQLQETFQRGILAGDDAILDEVKDSARERRNVLFGIYRHAYVARLAEVLAADYELVHAYLGDENFAKLAAGYVAANPSVQRSIRWFGRNLPVFIQNQPIYAGHAELADLAMLEKALADVFDAPDAEPLGLADLGAFAPEIWPRLVFHAHPASLRLTFQSNAADIWSALKEGAAPPQPARLTAPQAILAWRQDFIARFRPLPPEEAMMWDEAAKGVPFGLLCEMVATFGGESGAETRAATYLKGWVDTGLLAGCVAP